MQVQSLLTLVLAVVVISALFRSLTPPTKAIRVRTEDRRRPHGRSE